MMKILVPVALAIMLLSTPASATDGQSFADAVVGNSVLGKTGDGKKWAAYYKPGGEMTFNLDNGWSDSGKWWVDGEKFCQQWEQVRGGAKYCLAEIKNENGKWSALNEAINERQDIDLRQGYVSIY